MTTHEIDQVGGDELEQFQRLRRLAYGLLLGVTLERVESALRVATGPSLPRLIVDARERFDFASAEWAAVHSLLFATTGADHGRQ